MINLLKKFKVLALTAIVLSMTVFIANAGQATASAHKMRIITPNRARNFLKNDDMPTRYYENMGQYGDFGKYEARSDYLVLESRDSMRYINNLTYYVGGDRFIAKTLVLSLNVNDLSNKANAVTELINHSDHLMFKVTHKHLTPQMKKTILTKTSGQWIVQGYKIKFKKEIFPDEKPMEGVEPSSDHGAFTMSFIIEL